eukprot:sb/3469988/
MACCKDEAHNHDDPERGREFSLYTRIDMNTLTCLNESEEGQGSVVFKPWEERQDKIKFVDSDADEELMFNFSFTGSVKLKGIIVVGGGGETSPSHLKVGEEEGVSSGGLGVSCGGGEDQEGCELWGRGGETSPSHLKVFKNCSPMTFDDGGRCADQEFDIQDDKDAVLEYQTRVAKFNNCESLSLYFDKNFGADETRICYIGLRGEFSEVNLGFS